MQEHERDSDFPWSNIYLNHNFNTFHRYIIGADGNASRSAGAALHETVIKLLFILK